MRGAPISNTSLQSHHKMLMAEENHCCLSSCECSANENESNDRIVQQRQDTIGKAKTNTRKRVSAKVSDSVVRRKITKMVKKNAKSQVAIGTAPQVCQQSGSVSSSQSSSSSSTSSEDDYNKGGMESPVKENFVHEFRGPSPVSETMEKKTRQQKCRRDASTGSEMATDCCDRGGNVPHDMETPVKEHFVQEFQGPSSVLDTLGKKTRQVKYRREATTGNGMALDYCDHGGNALCGMESPIKEHFVQEFQGPSSVPETLEKKTRQLKYRRDTTTGSEMATDNCDRSGRAPRNKTVRNVSEIAQSIKNCTPNQPLPSTSADAIETKKLPTNESTARRELAVMPSANQCLLGYDRSNKTIVAFLRFKTKKNFRVIATIDNMKLGRMRRMIPVTDSNYTPIMGVKNVNGTLLPSIQIHFHFNGYIEIGTVFAHFVK